MIELIGINVIRRISVASVVSLPNSIYIASVLARDGNKKVNIGRPLYCLKNKSITIDAAFKVAAKASF